MVTKVGFEPAFWRNYAAMCVGATWQRRDTDLRRAVLVNMRHDEEKRAETNPNIGLFMLLERLL